MPHVSNFAQTTGDARKRIMAQQASEDGFKISCRGCQRATIHVNHLTPTNGLCLSCRPNERHWGDPIVAALLRWEM